MTKIDTKIEAIEKWIPNPFSDQPVEIDATNTKRYGWKQLSIFEPKIVYYES